MEIEVCYQAILERAQQAHRLPSGVQGTASSSQRNPFLIKELILHTMRTDCIFSCSGFSFYSATDPPLYVIIVVSYFCL